MAEEEEGDEQQLELTIGRHAKFLQRTLHVLPSSLANFDTQRVTISYFAVSGLDMLNRLDLVEGQRQDIVSWLYHCLVSPSDNSTLSESCSEAPWGFRGSPALRLDEETPGPTHSHDHGHVAMTYTALATLIILGDDLSGVNRQAIAAGLKALQLPDGSFMAALEGGENDMRFLYCATAISKMVDDWSGVRRDAALQYVLASVSYEGGIGQGPGLEAHGGSTYCAVAALSMMGMLEELGETVLAGVTRWCLRRQGRQFDRKTGLGEGFQGRPNKPEDTCYSFWVGATLALLGKLDQCKPELARQFVLSTQDPVTGGLAKWTDTVPDPLHTYLGLSGLAIAGEQGLLAVDPALNISTRASNHLASLHQGWAQQ